MKGAGIFAVGVALGVGVGLASALLELPSPAPPSVYGAGLVISLTTGYTLMDGFLAEREDIPD